MRESNTAAVLAARQRVLDQAERFCYLDSSAYAAVYDHLKMELESVIDAAYESGASAERYRQQEREAAEHRRRMVRLLGKTVTAWDREAPE